MTGPRDDQSFIFGLIGYLLDKHGISFFISPKDFDILYGWWEKRIPVHVIESSIDKVVRRRCGKGKPVDSFLNFAYEVKKNLGVHFELNIHRSVENTAQNTDDSINRFFNSFPEAIRELEPDFIDLRHAPEERKPLLLQDIHDRMIRMFEDDEELAIKTGIFMSNLPPAMQKPGIIRKFRINYLDRKFNIPDFG